MSEPLFKTSSQWVGVMVWIGWRGREETCHDNKRPFKRTDPCLCCREESYNHTAAASLSSTHSTPGDAPCLAPNQPSINTGTLQRFRFDPEENLQTALQTLLVHETEVSKGWGWTYSSKSCSCSKICQDNVVNIGFLDRYLRERGRKREGKTSVRNLSNVTPSVG